MSWGGKRTKENSSIAGSGGTTCDAQAFEWEVEHASIFVRLEAWERSRVVSHRKRGDKVWGSKERGGVVELATPFDGFVNLGEPPGCMRMTGNKKPLVEIRQRERTRAKGWGTPLGFKVTKEERRVMLGETWRAAYHGGPVVVREAPSRASRPLGTVKFNEAVKVSRKPDASALAAAPSTEKWVQVLGPVPGWMLTEDSSLGTLLRRDPVPDFPVELAVPRPRDRRKEGLRPRAAPPVAGACSATSRDDSEGWSDADSVASLDTTASNCTITPKEDLDLAPVCWISARSSCTPSDVRKLICLELPVAPEAVQIELELLGRKLLAPEAMTLWEMGLLGSDKVLWSLNCAGTADDDDDEATGAADPIAAAFARKYTVQPKHPIGTGALGPPLRIRGDASIKRVIEQLCEANPGLRDEGVVPVGAGKESDMPNVSSLGRVPVRFDAAVADAQAKRLVEERLAEEENEWTPWVYDAATGKRRRKKKRKKKKEQLEQEAYDRIGKGFSGETTYARETVLEDETTAWSAGLRDGGVFAFIYIGDIQHDLGWAEKLGLVEKMAEVQAKLSDAEIWADAQRARAAYCDASRAAAERAVASAKRLLAKDNAAKRIAEGERKKAKEERDAAKRELETYEEQEEPRSAFDEFAQFWATQQGDAGNAGEHEKDWATRMAEKGQDKDVDLSKSYCEDFMAWWRENRADDAGKRGNLTAKQRTKMELRERQSASEELKSRGDDRYKKGDFEQCAIEYTRCIAMCSRPDGHFALKVRNNRAAAYKQLGNHAAVAEDCTLVLRAWPENVKALLRRAEALEACEDYEGALEDVEAVLKIRATTRGEHEVGDKNAAKCVQDRSRLKRSVYELEHDETGEGKRRLAARRRKAEAAKSGASRIETSAQAAIRAKAEQDAAAFAVDFEDTRAASFEHKATLIWLAGPDMELDDLREHAEIFESKTRREFPELKVIVASPPPGRRLTPSPLHWFELSSDEWGARYLKPNGHHNWDCPPTEEEIAAMLKIPFWKRRPPPRPPVACTGLFEKAEETRRDRLLRAQVDEACAWVSRLVDRELRLVRGGYIALGGWDEGAVVAQHVALCRRFEKGPLGSLVPLNGPTPLLYHLIDCLDGGALAQTNMWTINGSHHDIFPRDVYGMHEKCLKPHVKTFSSQIVPYGHLEIADADFGYVVTILSMTIGPYKHKDLMQSDQLEKISKRAKAKEKAEDSDYESEEEKDTMAELRKSGAIQPGSYGGGGGGGGGYANADKMDYVKKDKNGNVRKHSKRCMCDKCQAEKKAKQDKVDKEARKAAREAKAQKNAVIRAKNQLTVMVRNAVIACKAAKAAAVDAAEAAENRSEQARHLGDTFLAG
ncbi:hypothetical protein JL722_1898 [Aureococcus anophagefferens]|nr:hypothetical protein JL722_1898 [Aureococcus anophagefferens]